MAKETDPKKIREIEIALGNLGKQADALRYALHNESLLDDPDQTKINAWQGGLKKVDTEMKTLRDRL